MAAEQATLNEKTLADVVKLARSGVAVQLPKEGAQPFVVIPEGYKVQDLSHLIFNEHNEKPERIKASVSVLDPGSFIEYHVLFSDPNSRVFADETALRIVSVLDYHGAAEGSPRWGQHRLTLTLRQSEEWKIWTAANNRKMDQQAFAEFLEQNSLDVTNPAPATMTEIASDLHASTEVEFGSGLRQQDGQVKFKYTEVTKSSMGGGEVSVPDRFTVTIPAFIGGERVPMDALLRFRVNQGKLTFWYTLVRPEEVIRTAFIESRKVIADKLSITIINGTPA